MTDKKFTISKIPGEYENRVFVGGNYESMAVLREIEKAVKGCGFEALMAYDCTMPEGYLHDYTMLLLHSCKYAIFDVTRPSGEMMELERIGDYGNIGLLLYQVKSPEEMFNLPGQINQMLGTMSIRRIGYHSFDILKKNVINFLTPHLLWGSNFPWIAVKGILGRDIDKNEEATYRKMLEARQITEYQVATAVLLSDEYKKLPDNAKTNETFIRNLFVNILGRDPAKEEFANALHQLENNLTTKQQLIIDFIQIDEVCETVNNVVQPKQGNVTK